MSVKPAAGIRFPVTVPVLVIGAGACGLTASLAAQDAGAEVLVLDLEDCCLSEVKRLCREFPGLSIVCTHRLADEELWAEALNQGAADMCETRNTDGIVHSVMRGRAHGVAA